jgi:hypothetical protein
MEKYIGLSTKMFGHLELISEGQKIDERKKAAEAGNANMTEEDRIFEATRMDWERGTVILVSSQNAKTTRWTPKRNR